MNSRLLRLREERNVLHYGWHSTIRQHPERAVPDEVQEIVAAGLVAHVAFSEDGQPFVIPMSYHQSPTRPYRLYLHGSRHSRRLLASGAAVSIAVTLVDGLVYSADSLQSLDELGVPSALGERGLSRTKGSNGDISRS